MGKKTLSYNLGAAPARIEDAIAGASVPRPPAGRQARTLVVRANGELRARLTTYVTPETSRDLRAYCASHELYVSDLVEEAIAEKLARLKKSGK